MESIEVDIRDGSISTMFVVVCCVGVVGKVIIPEYGFAGCVPVLHRVLDSPWIAVGRGDLIGSDLSVAVTEVPRNVDNLLCIVPCHRCWYWIQRIKRCYEPQHG